MHISLVVASCADGFDKRCGTHDAGHENDGRTPERPHCPWLVPGVGTL